MEKRFRKLLTWPNNRSDMTSPQEKTTELDKDMRQEGDPAAKAARARTGGLWLGLRRGGRQFTGRWEKQMSHKQMFAGPPLKMGHRGL